VGGEGVFASRVRWLISRGGRRPGGGCSGRRERGPGTRFVVGGFRGGEENCSEEHFALDTPSRVLRHAAMNAAKTRWCWRRDLAEFRGLTDRERTGFLLVLEWFENFRLRHDLAAGREAARAFWKMEVLREGRPREPWQLEQWEAALQWYLKWLEACAEAKADHRSLPERVRAAVQSAGGRRGHATTTKRCYGAWAARYAAFAGGEREVIEVGSASRFLTSVVDDEECAYSTQKQALNALAFFFKQVCGVDDPVFNVKLRKTGARVPVVLSKSETQRVFGSLSSPERYELPARLQYGAGLRRSELVRLRIKDVDLERGTLTVRQGKGDKDCPRLRRRPAACMAAPPQPWKVGKNVITFGAVGHAAAAQPARGGGPPDRGGAESLAARPSGGSGRGAHTGCAGAEVPPGRGELRVVLALSGQTDSHRPGRRRPATASPARPGVQRRDQARCGSRRDPQAGHKPLFAPQFCDGSARGWNGLADHPGVAGP